MGKCPQPISDSTESNSKPKTNNLSARVLPVDDKPKTTLVTPVTTHVPIPKKSVKL